jgi:hypothetical protein
MLVYSPLANVDELMAPCDQLEASQADATSTHSRLLNAFIAEAMTQSVTSELEVEE